MNDLQGRFRTLDEIDAPSQWADIEARAVPTRRSQEGSLALVTAAAAVLVVAIAGGVLSISSVGPGAGGSNPPGTATPVATPLVDVPGTWTATGSMTNPLDGPLVRLADGRVLVAGGSLGPSRVQPAAAVEVYDPATGWWTATGSMSEARSLHTATLLPDGKVLVAGGNEAAGNDPATALASAEVYDPRTGAWTATGSMVEPRALHRATLLPDGTVLVTGGYSVEAMGASPEAGHLASAELYDPRTGSWTATQSMTDGRAAHTATLLPGGKVLVAGGMDPPKASAELFDPRTGAWTATGSMRDGRGYHTATLLPNGNVLVLGGWSGAGDIAEIYDPGSGSWSKPGYMFHGQWGATATLLPSGMVLVAGGATCNGDPCFTRNAQLYDPNARSWTTTGSLAEARKFHSATLLLDGTVLLTGGTGGSGLGATGEWHRLVTAELYRSIVGN